jgi:hypothetical protein
MHLKITNSKPEPYSVDQLRMDNPNTSFPVVPSDLLLAGYDVFPYTRPAQPTVDWMTSTLTNGDFEQDPSGAWSQPFVVELLPVDDASGNVRSERNRLLQQTDWMALSDNTLTPEYAAYRQELRDVTSQIGFPYNVDWPVEP